MSLNDTEVQKQIQRLVAFIDQEADTKAEEIYAKAEEEFQIEKSRLVQNQRLKVMDHYSKKEKQLELAKKIKDSSLMHQARLKILQNREKFIEDLLNEARQRLSNVSHNREQYSSTLEGLITQGLLQLVESKVIVRCCEGDVDLVESLLPRCAETFKKMAKFECSIQLDKRQFLPDSCAGGVELTVADGRTRIMNTLESRLEQVAVKLMPKLREILFGANENRKFTS